MSSFYFPPQGNSKEIAKNVERFVIGSLLKHVSIRGEIKYPIQFLSCSVNLFRFGYTTKEIGLSVLIFNTDRVKIIQSLVVSGLK